MPIACYATLDAEQLYLRGLVGSEDGSQIIRTEITGPAVDAEALGIKAAEDLLKQGAAAILSEVYGRNIS